MSKWFMRLKRIRFHNNTTGWGLIFDQVSEEHVEMLNSLFMKAEFVERPGINAHPEVLEEKTFARNTGEVSYWFTRETGILVLQLNQLKEECSG